MQSAVSFEIHRETKTGGRDMLSHLKDDIAEDVSASGKITQPHECSLYFSVPIHLDETVRGKSNFSPLAF